MEVVHERCCGLDIHKKLIVACTIVPVVIGNCRWSDHRDKPVRVSHATLRGALAARAYVWLSACTYG